MNKAKQNYKSKCKKREVVFYIKDNDLYEKSKTINFQKFVKDCLRNKDKIYTFIILERGAGRKHWEARKKDGDKNGNGNI